MYMKKPHCSARSREMSLDGGVAPILDADAEAAGSEEGSEGESLSLTRVDRRRAANEELRFLCRMECISKMKEKIEGNSKLLLDDVASFKADLEKLKELWNQVTLEDLEFAARSTGRHLGKLFDMLTVRIPPVSVEIEDPIHGRGKKVHRLVRELPQDSVIYTAIKGKKKFFPYKTTDDADDIECMWGQHATEGFVTQQLSNKDWPVQVEVDVVGVGLMKAQDYADLVIMMVLAKFSGYATSAHALLYMCWKKQMPYYWANVVAACASITALLHITYCTKVLGCGELHYRDHCCTDSGFDRRFSPLVVLCMSLWFLITDIVYGFIILRETNYAKSVLWSSKVFEFMLEATTTVIAAKMAVDGWTFAMEHYVQYFLVVSCRWLHLLYLLLPVPVVGRTVLPMYQAVFSYESRAFIVVNLAVLIGSFQAYISLRSDINAAEYEGSLPRQIGDAFMAQYRLNFLGDFSTDELRGESQVIQENVITTETKNPQQRQGIALFMVVITFVQAVLLLNLYIGILGDSYSSHKEKIDTEFTQFRANFMLKNLCIVRFLNKYFRLQDFNSYLAWYEDFAEADVLWAVYPYEKEDGDAQPDLCPELKDEIRRAPESDLKALMMELGK